MMVASVGIIVTQLVSVVCGNARLAAATQCYSMFYPSASGNELGDLVCLSFLEDSADETMDSFKKEIYMILAIFSQ